MARKKIGTYEKAYRLLARYPEQAQMCRNDYSNDYIVRYGHISTSTVVALRKAIALTEGDYGSHTATFDYKW